MASLYSLDQKFSLVLDCYKSGLSIPAWCSENGIVPGTFYGWVKHVINKGYEVPDFVNHRNSNTQEIVKVSVVDTIDLISNTDVLPSVDSIKYSTDISVITAHIGNVIIDIPSNVDQTFLSKIFMCMKDVV